MQKGLKRHVIKDVIIVTVIAVIFIFFLLFINSLFKAEKQVSLDENISVTVPQNVDVSYEKTGNSVKVSLSSANESISEVEIIQPENKKITSRLAEPDFPKIKTYVFAVKEPIKIKQATITLAKKGIVDTIFYCPDYNFDSAKCAEWQPTNIPFTQTEKAITFTVDHFTAYAGGGLNSSYLAVWDETDYGMPYSGKSRQPGNNTFFYANCTNATSGNPVTDLYANLTINFSDSVSGNMAYNSTSKLWEYNRTFASEGTYYFTINATSQSYDNLTATDDVLIANCTIPYDDYYVNKNTRFCADSYSINDSGAEGVIIINASNIVVDFSNATVQGNASPYLYGSGGTGILVYNVSNVTINDFNFSRYWIGFSVRQSNGIKINNAKLYDAYPGSAFNIVESKNTVIKNIQARGFNITRSNNTNISGISGYYTYEYYDSYISQTKNTRISDSTFSFQSWEPGGAIGIDNSENITFENMLVGSSLSGGARYLIALESNVTSASFINFSTAGYAGITFGLVGNINGFYAYQSELGHMRSTTYPVSTDNFLINDSSIRDLHLNGKNITVFNSTISQLTTSSLGVINNSQFYKNNIDFITTVLSQGSIQNTQFAENTINWQVGFDYGKFYNLAFLNNLFKFQFSSAILINNMTVANNTFNYPLIAFQAPLNNSVVANNTFNGSVFLNLNNSEFSGNIGDKINSGSSIGWSFDGNNNIIRNSRISNSNFGSAFYFSEQRNNTVYNISAYNNTGRGFYTNMNITVENSSFTGNSEEDAFIVSNTFPYVFANFKNVAVGRLNIYDPFSQGAFLNATNLRIINENSSIFYDYFSSSNLTMIGNTNITLGYKYIYINTSALPQFNKSANITFFSLPFTITPQLLKDGVRCDNNPSLCNITSYDYFSGKLEAQVASFSNYTVTGQTCLNVTDDTYIIKNTTLCSGTYTITDSAGDGIIIINASNIIFNCNNAVIIGDSTGIGINSSSMNNNIIYNCNIRNYSSGILLYNSNSNQLRNSKFLYNTNGLYAESSSNNTINTSSFANSTNSGIVLIGSEGNRVLKNNLSNNSNAGIEVYDSFNGGVLISNNSITYNDVGINMNNNSGIFPEPVAGNYFNVPVAYNKIISNPTAGIYAGNSPGFGFCFNDIDGSVSFADTGAWIENSDNISACQNTIKYYYYFGMVLYNSTNANITSNSIFGIAGPGLNITESSANLSNNSIYLNTEGIVSFNSEIESASENISSNSLGLLLYDSNITGINLTLRDNSGYDLFSENSTSEISQLIVSPLFFIDSASVLNATPLLVSTADSTINYLSILIDNITNTTGNLFLGYNLAGIISENTPELNTSAQITFYGLLYEATPFVLKNGARCDNTPDCTIESYDNITGTLIFNVTSFTNYTTTQSNIPGTPDNESPTLPTVVDGYNYADYDWTNSNNTLYASWFGSTDRSKIFYSYRIMVNSTSCYNSQCALKDAGEQTQIAVTNLTLYECSNYSFQVQAEDTFYNVANLSSSDGIVVDTTPPVISSLTSTTHPDQNQQYETNSIDFAWAASDPGSCPSDIYAYSYVLDNQNDTAPDSIPELFGDTNATITDVPNGIWYFHIKARDNAGNWGETSTFKTTIAAPGISVTLNSTATPTLAENATVYGSISPENATYLLKVYVNSSETSSKTISNKTAFNFTVPLEIGINRIYVSAYVNNALKAVSNRIYVERLNESRTNITSFTIQYAGGTSLGRITYASSSLATYGIGTESSAASIAGNKITAPASEKTFIFVTRPGINTTERSNMLQNKTFFDAISPSLGYPLDIKQTIISTILNYQDLIIEGNTTVQTGRYSVVITNNGTKEGKPQIVVRIT